MDEASQAMRLYLQWALSLFAWCSLVMANIGERRAQRRWWQVVAGIHGLVLQPRGIDKDE
jgi:hypothetical protein